MNVLVSDCPSCPLTEKNQKKLGECVLTIWDVTPEQKLKTFKEGSTIKMFGVNPHKSLITGRLKNLKVFNKTKYMSIPPPPSFKSVYKQRGCDLIDSVKTTENEGNEIIQEIDSVGIFLHEVHLQGKNFIFNNFFISNFILKLIFTIYYFYYFYYFYFYFYLLFLFLFL